MKVICFAGVVAWTNLAAQAAPMAVPGDWTYLPPKDVDPALARRADPTPRKWSGQKASLRFATVDVSVSDAASSVCVDWRGVLTATNTATIRGFSQSLWHNYGPDRPAASSPVCYWLTRDQRIYRGAFPAAEKLHPVCVLVDGNEEDGFGGYAIGFENDGALAVTAGVTSLTLKGSGKPFVLRFDGTWLAGLQCVARARPAWMDAPADIAPDLWISIVAEWMQDAAKWNASADGWRAFLDARLARRRKLLADPRLRPTLEKGLIFITRKPPTWNHTVAQYFGWRQDPGGTVLVLDKPGRSLAVRDLIAGRLPSGSFLQPRLSYDAKKILFSFVATEGALDPGTVVKVNEEDGDHHYYHLWEMGTDGSGLKQLTRGVYEDFMPEFLPDGDIVFMSTRRRSQSRCFWNGYSNRWQAYTMYRMCADGSDIRQLSWNDVAEWFPTMSNDGEVLFARWDYIDRDAVRHQNLWKMRPDGTNPMAIWGNETPDPHCTLQPRAIPGSRKIVCVASAHHAGTGGPLILIDPAKDENSEAAITHVTPGHYPEIDIAGRRRSHPMPNASDPHYNDNDWYNSPHPYGEDLFLVAWSRDDLHYEPSRRCPSASLGLYILAADGTRELLYRDGCLSAQCAEPLVVRPMPPKWKSQIDPALRAARAGEVFISDIYRGLKKAKPGTLRQVRIVQIYPRTAPDQYEPNTGWGGHENARGVIGLADVEADGSCRFTVPAQVPLLFQVLDAKGRAWRTMRSTTSLMAGERVSCVGCHESKREVSAAAAAVSIAMKKPTQRLKVPPEGGRPWGFVENVQPIFDRKCIACHSGTKPPKGIDLTRTPDLRFSITNTVRKTGPRHYSAPFTRSYGTLCYAEDPNGRRTSTIRVAGYGPRTYKDPATGKSLVMVPNWPQYNLVQTTPEGYEGRGALTSGLLAKLESPGHAGRVTAEEYRMLASWLDLNATFYGCYEDPDLSKQLRGEPIASPVNP